MDTRTKFKLYLVQSGRKPNTIVAYLSCFDRLLREAPDLTPDEVANFLLQLKESGRKATYVNDFIDTMRIYGRSIGSEMYNNLTYFKEENYVKATMSDEEIKAFLELPPPTREVRNWRTEGSSVRVCSKGYDTWTLFFSILAYSGMRCGEVAHLSVDRVDLSRGIFVLEDTKTNTPRYVPIAPVLIPVLEEYIKKLDGDKLFPSKRGGQHRQNGVVDDVDWGYNFHQRLKRLGIKRKNLTPYSLRHSFITRMLEEDVNLFKVQKIVGHRQLATTQHYTHLTTTDIVKTIKKDRMTRGSLPSEEVLKDVVKTLKEFGFEDDPRFKYVLAENGDSIVFKLAIRKEEKPVIPEKL